MCADAPDTAGMERVAEKQLEFAESQYQELKPYLFDMAENQVRAQSQQINHANSYFNYNVNTFRPLEQQIVRDARRFSSQEFRQERAREAATLTNNAITNARRNQTIANARRGINPNSGLALDSAPALTLN